MTGFVAARRLAVSRRLSSGDLVPVVSKLMPVVILASSAMQSTESTGSASALVAPHPQLSVAGRSELLLPLLSNGHGDGVNTGELIQEAISLPVEERALIADSLLRSLNPTESEIDREWGREARRRLAELRSGSVAAVPGQRVFGAIRDKFAE